MCVRACALQFLGLLLLQYVRILLSLWLISIPWVYHIFLTRSSIDGFLVCFFGSHKSSHSSYPSFYVAVFSHCLCLSIGLWGHDNFLNSSFFEQCSLKPESFILVLALDQDLIHAGQCSASELSVALKIKHSH